MQAVQQDFQIPVIPIANLADLLSFLEKTDDNELKQYLPHVMEYRNRYGVIADGV